MYIYIGFTILVILLSFLDLTRVLYKKLILFFLFIVLVLFAGTRDSIGQDWGVYYGHFYGLDKTPIEPGFRFLQFLIQEINGGFYLFIGVIAFISISIKIFSLSSVSPLPLIAILFYFGSFYFPQELNQIRQGLASGICLLSIPLIYKRKFSLFSIVIFIACLFHISALVFWAAYPVYYGVKLSNKWLFFLLLGSSLFMFIDIGEVFNFFILEVFNKLNPIEIANRKLLNYINGRYAIKHGFYLGSLILIFYGVLFIVYKKKIKSSFYNGVVNCFLFGVFINFLFNSLSVLERASFYYLIIGAIPYSYIVKYEKHFVLKFGLFCILSLIVLLKVVDFVYSNSSFFIPYRSTL